MITPENVRSFTEQAINRISLGNTGTPCTNLHSRRHNYGRSIFDHAIEKLEKQCLTIETAGAENTSLQTRNTNLHTFVKDLVEVISGHDNDGYHHQKYQNAVQNHQKLKDSILCMKELLGDAKSRLILQNYNFKDFTHEDRQSFYDMPRQIGYKNNLNFVDENFATETSIEGLRDVTFNAICINVRDAITPNNPTGWIDLKEKEWKLSYVYQSSDRPTVVLHEFSLEEQEAIQNFNQQRLPTKDECIKNLNTFMKRFEQFEKETLPNTKKSTTESDEKNAW